MDEDVRKRRWVGRAIRADHEAVAMITIGGPKPRAKHQVVVDLDIIKCDVIIHRDMDPPAVLDRVSVKQKNRTARWTECQCVHPAEVKEAVFHLPTSSPVKDGDPETRSVCIGCAG